MYNNYYENVYLNLSDFCQVYVENENRIKIQPQAC